MKYTVIIAKASSKFATMGRVRGDTNLPKSLAWLLTVAVDPYCLWMHCTALRDSDMKTFSVWQGLQVTGVTHQMRL